jgi:hypothetical protein
VGTDAALLFTPLKNKKVHNAHQRCLIGTQTALFCQPLYYSKVGIKAALICPPL